MKKQDLRTLSPSAQEALRIRAVNAILGGMKQEEVVNVFGVSRSALNNWLRSYRESGAKSLKSKERGRPKGGGKLLPWQSAQVAKAVVHNHPEQLDLPGFLWTRDAVGELIEARFGIQYSSRHVGRLLGRWGFTPQKPAKRAYERDPKRVQRWLDEEYPAIQSLALKEKAEIHWEDETGIRSDSSVGRTWGKRGSTPIVPVTGKRFGCNLISTVNNQGKLYFMTYGARFNTKVFLSFLRRLLKQIEKKVFLVVDGHSVHRAKAIQKFVTENSEQIRIFYLPSYSPELNPDEYLNHDIKIQVTRRKRPANKTEMLKVLRSHLWKRQRQPEVVKNFFKHPAVRYAA